MRKCFKISKIENLRYDSSKKYKIEKRVYIIYPIIYRMVTMKKSDFTTSKNSYFNDYIASFKNINETYDALYQHSKIQGYSDITVKLEI